MDQTFSATANPGRNSHTTSRGVSGSGALEDRWAKTTAAVIRLGWTLTFSWKPWKSFVLARHCRIPEGQNQTPGRSSESGKRVVLYKVSLKEVLS